MSHAGEDRPRRSRAHRLSILFRKMKLRVHSAFARELRVHSAGAYFLYKSTKARSVCVWGGLGWWWGGGPQRLIALLLLLLSYIQIFD